MKNLNFQSAEVKQYFVHALKSLGLRQEAVLQNNQLSYQEMTEAQINELLSNPQITDTLLRKYIKLAIVQQFQNDVDPLEKNYLKDKTAFDRQTLKKIIRTVNPNITEDDCEHMLRGLTAAGVDNDGNILGYNPVQNAVNTDQSVEQVNNSTVDAVITAMMKGCTGQKMDADVRGYVQEIWNDILYAEFGDELIQSQQQNFDRVAFENWKRGKNQNYSAEYERYRLFDLWNKVKTWLRQEFGNSALINQPIKTGVGANQNPLLMQLKANNELLKQSLEFCRQRLAVNNVQLQNGQTLEDALTLGDVLAVSGNEKAQIVTFFQTRSAEQQHQAEIAPKQYECKKENKIGNTLGDKGRAYVKKQTGSNAVLDYDAVKALKAGKKGPWRGFGKLLKKIEEMEGRRFKSVQAIGFTTIAEQRFFKISATSNVKREVYERSADHLINPVQTDYQQNPDDYRAGSGLTAGEFYTRTKARMIRDKVAISEITYLMKGADENAQKDYQKLLDYYQKRITTAQNVLTNRMPNKNASEYNDPTYFAGLEESILDEYANRSNQTIMQNIQADRNKRANESVADMLNSFEYFYQNGRTGEAAVAKREIAKTVFNLDSAVENGIIKDRDLDGMTDRFFNGQQWQSGMLNALRNPQPGQDISELTVDKMQEINDFVITDLQNNAQKTAYDAFTKQQRVRAEEDIVQKNRQEIWENTVQDRMQ